MSDLAGLPDWIPREDWEGWIAMRKKIKKPMTERAMKMAQSKLLELRNQGQDVGKVLQQSEFNNWTDLYPVRAPAIVSDGGFTGGARLSVVPPSEWWKTASGIDGKGAALGLKIGRDEVWPAWRARVFQAAGNGPWNANQRGAVDVHGMKKL